MIAGQGLLMKQIRYEELSKEIKKEIEAFQQEKSDDLSLAEAMALWFEEYFDSWLNKRFRDLDDSNKRQYFRLDVEIPLRVIDTILETSDDDHEARSIVGDVLNISRGGLYFRSDRNFRQATVLKVDIDLTNIFPDLKDITALAMVMRNEQLDENSYGIGVMFSSIYDEDKNVLDSFIIKKLSNYIYNQ